MSVKWNLPYLSGEADGTEGKIISCALGVVILGLGGVCCFGLYCLLKGDGGKAALEPSA